MVKIYSDQNQLAFFYEPDTYGIGSVGAAAPPQWIGLVQDHTPDENINNIQIRYQGSTDRNVDTFANGALDFAGTFTYFPQDWKFLGFAIGSIDETAAAGSHVISETNSDDVIYAGSTNSLISFTLEDSKKAGTGIVGSNFIRTFGGCMVDSFTTTFTQGEVVNVEVGYMAQTGSLGSGTVIATTPTTTRPYLWSDTELQIPSGTTYDNATEITFTVNNNLEMGHYLNGSREVKEFLPLNRDYELGITLAMDNTNARILYNHFISGTTFNAMVQSIGTPGSLFLVMSGCKVDDMEVPSLVEGVQEQTLTIIPKNVSAVVHDSILNYNAK